MKLSGEVEINESLFGKKVVILRNMSIILLWRPSKGLGRRERAFISGEQVPPPGRASLLI